MREIKFRAIVVKSQLDNLGPNMNFAGVSEYEVMVDVRDISFNNGKIDYITDNDGEEYYFSDNSIKAVMQYSGLKDKNGVEIYEGDILLFNNDYPNAQKADWKCVVKYRKGSFVCEYPKDGVYNHFDSWNVPKVTWEVIGNIYDNPELLEAAE